MSYKLMASMKFSLLLEMVFFWKCNAVLKLHLATKSTKLHVNST